MLVALYETFVTNDAGSTAWMDGWILSFTLTSRYTSDMQVTTKISRKECPIWCLSVLC